MKYVDDFRNSDLARQIARRIHAAVEPERRYRLMEFCGGHTHAIARYGLTALLPPCVELIHGPGCPVCVLPVGRIDSAIELALEHRVTLCTYGDTLRVPASRQMSLYKARAEGADVRVVYSSADTLTLARDRPDRQVVFFGIGFETTTPATAVALLAAQAQQLENFTVFSNHVLTPAAMQHLLADDDANLDGFIGPSHVSTIIGIAPYRVIARDYRKPVVITGFEPLDVLQAVLMLVTQINEDRADAENQFTRAVTEQGNLKAQALVAQTFELRNDFEWRGLGLVPDSALAIRAPFAQWDAEKRFNLSTQPVADVKACQCGHILRGHGKPTDCKVFGTACTPAAPLGACMVSSEGACAAHYQYARFNDAAAAGCVHL
ncbi:protein required for maturation of hydrogenases [Paraburkholderia piptadeniae]|uniref:Hydrogenase maturation factor n=2 Tax=Paraburkholderia TaxID=1822464 RepID=A0A7X1NJA7_9BURK|nr:MULTISPECIES: hydrogenase formation protein HypD [Paraburkholderia]MPW22882.1 hydrogenase formation protein HypD [Paraburkholderia franconis]SIT52193.1 protein required for maturation of hydrogenases [Paraburkholderia piptadeniae]